VTTAMLRKQGLDLLDASLSADTEAAGFTIEEVQAEYLCIA